MTASCVLWRDHSSEIGSIKSIIVNWTAQKVIKKKTFVDEKDCISENSMILSIEFLPLLVIMGSWGLGGNFTYSISKFQTYLVNYNLFYLNVLKDLVAFQVNTFRSFN
jgi:hypothetical protein